MKYKMLINISTNVFRNIYKITFNSREVWARGLVAMTTRLHRVDPQFESGRAHSSSHLRITFTRWWLSGTMGRCQRFGRGSIPRQRIFALWEILNPLVVLLAAVYAFWNLAHPHKL